MPQGLSSAIESAQYGYTNKLLPAIVVPPSGAAVQREVEITAAGNGMHDYQLLPIDLRQVAGSGTLDIDVQIHPDSATAGSFDLFQSGAVIPVSGRPTTSMGGRYDVAPGTHFRLSYKFSTPGVVLLGAEGNWFSAKGASGLVDISVHLEVPGGAAIAGNIPAQGQAAPQHLATGQVWRGSYTCSQGATPLTLRITDIAHGERETPYGDGRYATADFEFGGQGSGIPRGSYRLEGAVLDDGQVRLAPRAWIRRPPGYMMVGLSGRVDARGNFTGRIADRSCGAFELRLLK